MRLRATLALLLATCALLVQRDAVAKPMVSTLDAIVGKSSSVVIATFRGQSTSGSGAVEYELVVDRTLHGSVAPGTIRVGPSPDGHASFPAGTRLVAFIDASNAWIASATLAAGPSLEDGALRVRGFYDFNAHMVTPGVLTLAQLENYVSKKVPFRWTFRGKLLLPTPTGLQPSSIAVTAEAPSNTVTGLPGLRGFPAPTVSVGAGYSDDLRVEYQATLGRPLRLVGTVVGRNADDSIEVTYRLEEPPILREADLRRYLSTPSLGHPFYVLRVNVGSGTEPLVIGKEIGRIGTLGTTPISSVSLAPTRSITAGPTTLTLSPAAFQTTARGTTGALVEELVAGPITCVHESGGTRTPCSISYVETKFATP